MLTRIHLNLHKILKERIKGHIFIGLKDDFMEIHVEGIRGLTYKIVLDDIYNENDIEKVADKVEKDYRKFIMKKFFVRRGR